MKHRPLHLAGVLVLFAALPALARAVDAPSAIPFKHETIGQGASLPGGAMGLLLVSALAIVAVYFVRKRLNLSSRNAHGPRLLRVLESQRLGPRALLSVVEFAGGQYLIAQSEHGVICLAASPANPPEAPTVLPREHR